MIQGKVHRNKIKEHPEIRIMRKLKKNKNKGIIKVE
jgi:hypothetical protein